MCTERLVTFLLILVLCISHLVGREKPAKDPSGNDFVIEPSRVKVFLGGWMTETASFHQQNLLISTKLILVTQLMLLQHFSFSLCAISNINVTHELAGLTNTVGFSVKQHLLTI